VQLIKSGACGSATAATNHDASDANYSSNLTSDVDESNFLAARYILFLGDAHYPAGPLRDMKRNPTLEILTMPLDETSTLLLETFHTSS
jgi:hypothetical protein